MHRLDQSYLDQPLAEALGVRFVESPGAQSLAELRDLSARQIQHRLLELNLAPFSRYYNRSLPEADKSEGDLQMSATMWNYWVSFIKTGNPNKAGQPEWKPYTQSSRDYMRFEKGRAQPSGHLLPGMWELYEKIRLRDEETGQFRSWQGGSASDSLLSNKNRLER